MRIVLNRNNNDDAVKMIRINTERLHGGNTEGKTAKFYIMTQKMQLKVTVSKYQSPIAKLLVIGTAIT